MCGIAGSFGRKLHINQKDILNLNKALMHRGPDYQNYVREKQIFFYHARLSIIDIRNISHQPMYSSDKSLLIVFNGEIYNYIELKNKLSTYNFKTKSDTEVILAAYKKWGKECLDKLSGAFSFCIYDMKKKNIFFARDRFGQKPFFYCKNKEVFNFASEVKGLIALGYKPLPNRSSWHDYLINGQTDEKSDTFFKGVKQLLPGEFGILDSKNNLKIQRWYDLKKKIKKNIQTYDETLNEIFEKLKKSVEICSRADVPVALSLSGGLDSSTLFSIQNKFNYTKYSPKAYSIDFGKDFSEKKYINLTTSRYNQKSKLINFTCDDWIKSIKPSIWSLESPSGGLMNCAATKMNFQIKKDGFKVVQDGTGLDEIFGGYEYHHLMYLNEIYSKSEKNFQKQLNLFCKNWGYSKKIVLNKIENLNNSLPKTIDSYDLINRKIFKKDFINFKDLEKFKIKKLKNSLIQYIQNSKIPKNNRLKDRMSMAFGLELRLPFIEHPLVEYGLGLPNEYYFLKGRSKSILRESVKGILNNSVRTAKKFSIQSPQNNWFKKKVFIEYFEDIIFSESFKSRNYYNVEIVHKMWEDYLKNENNFTSFYLWQIINFENWHRIFIDNNSLKNIYKFNY
jgi:asparagine synthase (glutamine-hydrolysing)